MIKYFRIPFTDKKDKSHTIIEYDDSWDIINQCTTKDADNKEFREIGDRLKEYILKGYASIYKESSSLDSVCFIVDIPGE